MFNRIVAVAAVLGAFASPGSGDYHQRPNPHREPHEDRDRELRRKKRLLAKTSRRRNRTRRGW